MGKEHFVTMADVARAAGVHPSTVSLSLRNSPLIPEATRRAVAIAAERLHYRPHPLVSTLMQRRRAGKRLADRPVLAFVTAFPTRDGWRRNSPVVAEFLRGAIQRGEKKGFRVTEFWMREDGMTARRFSEVLHTRNIHGLLLAPLPSADATLDLAWDKFCTVALGLTVGTPVHRVSHDHYDGMLLALDHCYNLGYRRIGFATNALVHHKVQQRWLAAYLIKQQELSSDVLLPPLVPDNWSEPVVRAWYRRHRPDVIISNHPVPLRDWIKNWGLKIPRDIGLINLSCPSLSDPTSGTYQNGEVIGERAVDQLVGLIEHNEAGIPAQQGTLLVRGIWNPGRTVSPQPADRRGSETGATSIRP